MPCPLEYIDVSLIVFNFELERSDLTPSQIFGALYQVRLKSCHCERSVAILEPLRLLRCTGNDISQVIYRT